MSPHILIDQQLEALTHPSTPPEFEAIIQRQLVEMMKDEQIEEAQAAQVRGTVRYPVGMRVADLPYPIKADWLKRRPIARPRPCP